MSLQLDVFKAPRADAAAVLKKFQMSLFSSNHQSVCEACFKPLYSCCGPRPFPMPGATRGQTFGRFRRLPRSPRSRRSVVKNTVPPTSMKSPMNACLCVSANEYVIKTEQIASLLNIKRRITFVVNNNSNIPPVCFVIGAMSTGHVTINDYPMIEKMVSLSEYPLSGAAAIARLLTGIEQHWGII